MYNTKKKGFMSFAMIIGLILLLLTFTLIAGTMRNFFFIADEEGQVEVCRLSNVLKYNLKDSTGGLKSNPSACFTIDKYSKKKSMVPTPKYEKEGGIQEEIIHMVERCNYMFLDGQKQNMFENRAGSNGCFRCYDFKIEENALEDIKEGVKFQDLLDEMGTTFKAKKVEEECIGDFEAIQACEKEKAKIKTVCERNGGKCLKNKDEDSGHTELYTDWSCAPSQDGCYVTKEMAYSYTRYFAEGIEGGNNVEVYFMPPGEGGANTKLESTPIYSVSFLSPAEYHCWDEESPEDESECYTKVAVMGTGAIAIGIVVIKGAVVLKSAGTAVVSVGKAISTVLPKSTVLTLGVATGYVGSQGAFGNWFNDLYNFIASPITVPGPNMIIVSTRNNAENLGCQTISPDEEE